MKKIITKRHHLFKHGFTLTEVLLAVMIVGLIGVALASLTRAAAREGGMGRSKILLRNNLSAFMRTLRNDLANASIVTPKGIIPSSESSNIQLLKIGQNVTYEGTPLSTDVLPKWILYCFNKGSDQNNIVPSTATRGGEIYRIESGSQDTECGATENITKKLVLNNVKYIPSGLSAPYNYPVPLFARDSFSRDPNLLIVKIITELNSTPIVNDVVVEDLTAPMGY